MHKKSNEFVELPFKQRIVSIACSNYSNAACGITGSVYYWGKHWSSNSKDVIKPIKLNYHQKLVRVFMGKHFLIGLTEERTIVSLGNGGSGQLGNGERSVRDEFTEVDMSSMASPAPPRKFSEVNNFQSIEKKTKSRSTGIFKSKKTLKLSTGHTYSLQSDPKIICGRSSVAVIVEDKIYMWGKLNFASLEPTIYLEPVQITQFSNVQIRQLSFTNKRAIVSSGMQSAEEITFRSFNPPVVERGTEVALIKHLLHPEVTQEYSDTFFTAYTVFTREITIIRTLRNLFDSCEDPKQKSSIKSGCLRVIERLLKQRSPTYDPWSRESDLFLLTREVVNTLSEGNKSMSSKLLKMMTKDDYNTNEQAVREVPSETLGLVFTYSPFEVAQQLCLAAMSMFKKIHVTEFLGQKWNKPNKGLNAPGLTLMIAAFNNSASWLTTAICTANGDTERSMRANFFIEVFNECVKLSNFYSATWIWSAFQSVPVYKLKKNKKLSIKKKNEQSLKSYQSYLDSNSTKYRELLKLKKESSDPLLPYIGLHLTDLTFTEDASHHLNLDGKINFSRLYKVSSLILFLMDFQKRNYVFTKTLLFDYFYQVKGLGKNKLVTIVDQIIQDGEFDMIRMLKSSNSTKRTSDINVADLSLAPSLFFFVHF